jgi:hypothetical protein
VKNKKYIHSFSQTIWREQRTRNEYCRCRLEDNIKINVIYMSFFQVQFFMFRKTTDMKVHNSLSFVFS